MNAANGSLNEPLSNETRSSPESRAARLRRLRNLANLSRKEMCERFAIKMDTLIGWEVARHGGLTENGAKKIISCIANEGVQCSLEWLLYEIGSSPLILPSTDKVKSNSQTDIPLFHEAENEEKSIIEELLFFRSRHPSAIDFIVKDDGMEPQYSKGNYVAGIKYKENIHQFIGDDCIVQLADGKILLRHLLEGTTQNRYILLCTNTKTTTSPSVIVDAELVCAAPVIWIRKKILTPKLIIQDISDVK